MLRIFEHLDYCTAALGITCARELRKQLLLLLALFVGADADHPKVNDRRFLSGGAILYRGAPSWDYLLGPKRM